MKTNKNCYKGGPPRYLVRDGYTTIVHLNVGFAFSAFFLLIIFGWLLNLIKSIASFELIHYLKSPVNQSQVLSALKISDWSMVNGQ